MAGGLPIYLPQPPVGLLDKLQDVGPTGHTLLTLVALLLLLKSAGLFYLYRRKTRAYRNLRHAVELMRTFTHLLSEETETVAQLNEQLQHEQEMRLQLTQMLVHDLKTPLQSILVSGHIADVDLRQRLIEGSALQLHHLVHNILDLYKYKHEGQSLPLDRQQLRLQQVVAMALVQVTLPFELKGQQLITRIEPEDLSITADLNLLLRVLVNLLSNANKYGLPNRPVELHAYTMTAEAAVRVEIRNEGPAIPPVYRNDLFNLYRTPTQLKQGHFSYSTGLGLAFCRLAVEAHGGLIGYDSPPEGPVCFWFELPLESRKEPQVVGAQSPPATA